MLHREVAQGISTDLAIDVEHGQVAIFAALNAHVGVRPLPPPKVDLLVVRCGQLLPILKPRMLAGARALQLATRALAVGFDVVAGENLDAVSRVAYSVGDRSIFLFLCVLLAPALCAIGPIVCLTAALRVVAVAVRTT